MIDDSLDSVEATESATGERPPPVAPPGTRPRRTRRVLRRIFKVALWCLVGLLVLVLGVAGYAVYTVRRSLPQYEGTLRLAGLTAPVTVYRDAQAVPQIYARNVHDLFKAQGYVAAQERFWEMDFDRHVTSGRLSELFGADQVATDRLLRTMDWRGVAAKEWQLISPQSRRYLQDYADGVNAYLAGKSTASVSLEYSILGLQTTGYTIAKWDPVDSLAWLKALAWDLRGNIGDEVTRATLLASGLTRDQVESLYPAYPAQQNAPILSGGSVTGGPATGGPATGGPGGGTRHNPAPGATSGTATFIPASFTQASATPATGRLPALTGSRLSGIGSNSFVVSGALTSTGKPILENDPHLSPSMPGIWFQVGLHCSCDYNVAGFAFSSVPGVIIGHNARIAWGFTNLNPDVVDLYLEKVRGNQYLVDGAWRDLDIRQETIKVAGGAPQTLTIRTTNNGPLLDGVWSDLKVLGSTPAVDPSGTPVSTRDQSVVDPVSGDAYAVAMRWTALTPGRSMDALFALNTAHDWASFRQAVRQFAVPSQNITYADVDGNIGYQAPGQIPIRGKGDGRWPAPGWDSAYDWRGYIPFNALPYVFNPPQGYIVTANQQVIDPASYPYLLSGDWSNGYRSQRIADLITAAHHAGKRITVNDAQRFAFDNFNELAKEVNPVLLQQQLAGVPADAQALLRGWDFQQPADGPAGSAQARSSAAAAFFNATWQHLLADTFDELPAAQQPNGDDRWWLVVSRLMRDPAAQWWDLTSTPQVERRDDIVARAMRQATAELSARLGADPQAWRWGAIHTLDVVNQSFGTSGIGPVEWLFNRGPVAVGGGGAIVNATGWDPATHDYHTNAVPSMRMIVDMSNLDASRWIQLTGESGHAFSAHYDDQLELWRTGQTVPMRWEQQAIKHAAKDTLTLTP